MVQHANYRIDDHLPFIIELNRAAAVEFVQSWHEEDGLLSDIVKQLSASLDKMKMLTWEFQDEREDGRGYCLAAAKSPTGFTGEWLIVHEPDVEKKWKLIRDDHDESVVVWGSYDLYSEATQAAETVERTEQVEIAKAKRSVSKVNKIVY